MRPRWTRTAMLLGSIKDNCGASQWKAIVPREAQPNAPCRVRGYQSRWRTLTTVWSQLWIIAGLPQLNRALAARFRAEALVLR